MLRFEWSQNKSEANLVKHGIDFAEATAFWSDPYGLVMPSNRRGERRYSLYARHSGAVWTAAYTMRGDIIRVITVRRATRWEAAEYDRYRFER